MTKRARSLSFGEAESLASLVAELSMYVDVHLIFSTVYQAEK